MGATPNLAIPYPELTDSPDVPRDMKSMADRVDSLMGGLTHNEVKRWWFGKKTIQTGNSWATAHSAPQWSVTSDGFVLLIGSTELRKGSGSANPQVRVHASGSATTSPPVPSGTATLGISAGAVRATCAFNGLLAVKPGSLDLSVMVRHSAAGGSGGELVSVSFVALLLRTAAFDVSIPSTPDQESNDADA